MSEKQGFESPPPTYNQAQGYPPPQQGYPPQQEGYPPQQQGYPPQQQGYQPQGQPGYPAQPGYAPVPQGYPPQQCYPQGQPQPTVIVAQPMSSNVVVSGPAPPDYLVASVLACLCCFWPTGLCAIYYACRRNTLMGEGNIPEATQMSTSARNFVIASVVLGICVIVISIVIRVVAASTAASAVDHYYDY